MISEVDELEIFSMFSLPTIPEESSCRSIVECVSITGGFNVFDSVFCFKEIYINVELSKLSL